MYRLYYSQDSFLTVLDDDVDANLDGSQSGEARLPTGHVVGILQHRWRDCVGSLSSDEVRLHSCHNVCSSVLSELSLTAVSTYYFG